MYAKRVVIATVMGAVCGGICLGFASSHGKLPWDLSLSIFTGRMLIGFVIGISAMRLNWALHGLLLGALVSLPSAISSMMGAPALPWSPGQMFFMSWVMGILYGFLIELVTSVVFKARQK